MSIRNGETVTSIISCTAAMQVRNHVLALRPQEVIFLIAIPLLVTYAIILNFIRIGRSWAGFIAVETISPLHLQTMTGGSNVVVIVLPFVAAEIIPIEFLVGSDGRGLPSGGFIHLFHIGISTYCKGTSLAEISTHLCIGVVFTLLDMANVGDEFVAGGEVMPSGTGLRGDIGICEGYGDGDLFLGSGLYRAIRHGVIAAGYQEGGGCGEKNMLVVDYSHISVSAFLVSQSVSVAVTITSLFESFRL